MDLSLVDDLLENPKVTETREHLHHGISKFDHLMRVTRYAYKVAHLVGADTRVCVRAGLIHDIDSRYGTLTNHGEVAARWAAEQGEDEEICEAIVSHMFPFGPVPTTREGWVLTVADKAASVADLADYMRGMVNGSSRKRRAELESSDPFHRPKPKAKRRERIRSILDIEL